MIQLILCGGNGTRLWPLSREEHPKQLLQFFSQSSLLQRILHHNQAFCSEFVVVCNNSHFTAIKKQLKKAALNPKSYLLEPLARNTAAAVCLAMLSLDPEEIVLITPSDHYIDYSEDYANALEQANKHASQDRLALFGISPSSPETGFGYIQVDSCYQIKSFHEKPSLESAKEYLTKGNYYWNAGMICVKPWVFLEAMQCHAPHILAPSQLAYQKAKVLMENPETYQIFLEDMLSIPAESIDHALLEKMPRIHCVPSCFSWSDMGSFASLFSHSPKDENGNAIHANQLCALNSKNNLIIGKDRLLSLIDIEGLAIVDTPDALLISKLDSTQKVKDLVHQVQALKPNLEDNKTKAWKAPQDLSFGYMEHCEATRFILLPGKQAEMENPHSFPETWIVLEGTALITTDQDKQMVYALQSIAISPQQSFTWTNLGITNLVLLKLSSNQAGQDHSLLMSSNSSLKDSNPPSIN
ncbi:mannose-1-phosphate guanylyltransferase [Candidatus Protochlamydia phocaeensis]|uniref:mannose-1-phosphate guanylyltransferase n=1 Tax=Candidatus Protochlamydia phocaeensis TaxID=1414722 RepID=UPI0008392277|nr:sugar phosphate nucleotidyltransferase [Candidatus Protochlamydia phocaeensis]